MHATIEAVGWGIIGGGGWARSTFAPAVASAANAQLRGVLSRDPGRAAQLTDQYGGKPYGQLDDFLDDERIEVVWVASPNALHAPQTLAALARGKHVLCEKPLALNVSEAKAMLDAAQRSQRQLGIGYHMRQHPAHRRLQKEFAAGQFGAPVYVRAQLYYAYPEPPDAWRQHRATSGGWALCDIGTHLVDLLRWFLGEPVDVHGLLSSPRFGFETDDHAVVACRFDNGAVGLAEASTGAGGLLPRLEIYGTEGFAVCEGTLFGGGTLARGQRGQNPKFEQLDTVNLYVRQVEEFSAALRGDGTFAAPAEEGLRNLHILEKARGW